MSANFCHGQNCRSSGSVDIGCSVQVLGVEGSRAVVELFRPSTPYGAPAAIGSVFLLDIRVIHEWPDLIHQHSAECSERKNLANKYGVNAS